MSSRIREITLPAVAMIGALGFAPACNSLTGANDLKVDDGANAGAAGAATGGSGGAATGGTAGSTGGTAGQSGGSGGSGACSTTEKQCDGGCVDIDNPTYGCTPSGCAPCEFVNADAACNAGDCEMLDCHTNYTDCDGEPGCEEQVDDGNPCTNQDCGHTPAEPGTSCGGDRVCDGAGNCVECQQGMTRCNDSNEVETCGSAADWTVTESCTTPSPVCADGGCRGVLDVAAGSSHTCALLSNDTVWCWGDNALGQLGDTGLVSSSTKPIPVDLEDVASITAGANHTCVTTASRDAYCWGDQSEGQVGAGEVGAAQPFPSPVSGMWEVRWISAGGAFTCAQGIVNGVSGAYCWGRNMEGQLGIGTVGSATSEPLTPLVVPDDSLVWFSAGHRHACAILQTPTAPTLWCWGDNSSSQANPGSALTEEPTPTTVSAVTALVPLEVHAGGWHTCAQTQAQVHCWGSNERSQLGRPNDVTLYTSPVRPNAGDPELGSLAAGGQHNCALGADDELVYCFGINNHGQLGIGGATYTQHVPTLVAMPSGNQVNVITASIDAGDSAQLPPNRGHSCAIDTNSNLYCWGNNERGQLGNGNTTQSSVPVKVAF